MSQTGNAFSLFAQQAEEISRVRLNLIESAFVDEEDGSGAVPHYVIGIAPCIARDPSIDQDEDVRCFGQWQQPYFLGHVIRA